MAAEIKDKVEEVVVVMLELRGKETLEGLRDKKEEGEEEEEEVDEKGDQEEEERLTEGRKREKVSLEEENSALRAAGGEEVEILPPAEKEEGRKEGKTADEKKGEAEDRGEEEEEEEEKGIPEGERSTMRGLEWEEEGGHGPAELVGEEEEMQESRKGEKKDLANAVRMPLRDKEVPEGKGKKRLVPPVEGTNYKYGSFRISLACTQTPCLISVSHPFPLISPFVYSSHSQSHTSIQASSLTSIRLFFFLPSLISSLSPTINRARA